jgi:hypothetical protein
MAGRGGDERADTVEAAKDELYGLSLSQFTAARAERAKQARAAGDQDAARVIAKLPKPNVVAWLANQLARRHPDELRPILELGESLRRATADLDAARLSQLSGQQRRAVSALMGRARELAAEVQQAVSDSTSRGLEDTLHAALADEQAAQDLARGELTAGLSRTGFPGLDAAAEAADVAAARGISAQKRTQATASAKPRTAARPGSSAASEQRAAAAKMAAETRRRQLDRARRAEADARDQAEEASRERVRIRTVVAAAADEMRQTEENISRLQDQLDTALDARQSAGRAQRQARKDADRADRIARQAERRLSEATALREELERDA